MNLKEKMQRRLKLNRPSLRGRARPPKQRTQLGQQFSAANLSAVLALPCCQACGHVQYPPTELCGACLSPDRVYGDIEPTGTVLQTTDLHVSQWEYFKRRIKEAPWRVASVKLTAGPVVICHLADDSLSPGAPCQVFSHSDASLSAVLIAVSPTIDIHQAAQRSDIVRQLGLDRPALKTGGI